jgi:hypothetical protein
VQQKKIIRGKRMKEKRKKIILRFSLFPIFKVNKAFNQFNKERKKGKKKRFPRRDDVALTMKMNEACGPRSHIGLITSQLNTVLV